MQTTPTQRLVLPVAVVAVLALGLGCSGDSRDDADRIHASTPAESQPGGGEASGPGRSPSGIVAHEHEPRHGGVVRSVDVYHVEVVADPIAVWLYDRRGNPVPLDDVDGQLVVYSEDRRSPVLLERSEGRLAPIEEFELPDSGTAFVELTVGKQPVDVALTLPLTAPPPGRPSDPK